MAIERFIARPIRSVSIVPEAPTSIPLTISTLFSSSKPVAAAARPVNAFRSEITTGMSAPPIGSTKSTPKRRAPHTTVIRALKWNSGSGVHTTSSAVRCQQIPI